MASLNDVTINKSVDLRMHNDVRKGKISMTSLNDVTINESVDLRMRNDVRK